MASSHAGRPLRGGRGTRRFPAGRGPAGRFPERLARRTRLDEHLPVDHRLSTVYRIGAGLMGLVLLAFGILGLIGKVGFFDTGGDTVAGLNTNGALSVLSIVVGCVLFGGMVIGGNFASSLNMWFGVAFLLSGFFNLALLETDYNFLAFRLQNVLFSFVFGLLLMTFGMYGRVSGHLPHDNPYWQARHPGQVAHEEQAALRARAKRLAIQAQQQQERPPLRPWLRPPEDRGGDRATGHR
ncbi:DUF4383 domain-containing protein [Streptomyces sp. 7N604]|uniref:DUF4383 domain-containing protein n=1 Tax=Streptomyces sp. 7N604 TaxID=3457415 RepID=UPI003FCF86AE